MYLIIYGLYGVNPILWQMYLLEICIDNGDIMLYYYIIGCEIIYYHIQFCIKSKFR